MDFDIYKILAIYGLILLATIAYATNKGALPWAYRITINNYPITYLIFILCSIVVIFYIS